MLRLDFELAFVLVFESSLFDCLKFRDKVNELLVCFFLYIFPNDFCDFVFLFFDNILFVDLQLSFGKYCITLIDLLLKLLLISIFGFWKLIDTVFRGEHELIGF